MLRGIFFAIALLAITNTSFSASLDINLEKNIDALQKDIDKAVNQYIESVQRDVDKTMEDAKHIENYEGHEGVIIEQGSNSVCIGTVSNEDGTQKNVHRITRLNNVTVIIDGKKE